MGNPFSNFLLVLVFFTRLPLPQKLGEKIGHDTNLSHAVPFFPMVGFLVGVFLAGIWYLAASHLPSSLAAAITVAAGLLLTGALHEDGFADCADGLGGSSNRDKSLEIMKDSRIGSYGGLALIVTVLVRWSALAALALTSGVLALVIAHTVSRFAMVIAMKTSTYARSEGLGKMASGEVTFPEFTIAFGIATVVAIGLGGIAGLTAAAVGLLTSWILLKYLEKRLGGYTGDGLGAMQQIAEITVLITLTGFWT